MSFRNLLIALLLVGLAACESDTTGPDQSSELALPDEAAEATESAEPGAEAEVAAVEQEAINTVTESAAIEEEVEDEQEAIIIADEEVAVAEAETSDQWQFKEGRHFRRFTTAQGTSSAPDKIEVAEIFWYGCQHCYDFEPYIDNWETELPADVEFVRVPVMWNTPHQIHARAFYTAQALGKIDEIHGPMFREIHINNNPLTTEASLQAFFEDFGVSEEEFQKTFRSFAINGKIKRAMNLTERYQVRSVPTLVVNGKYTTDAPDVASQQQRLDIANELVERERQRL